MCLLVSATPTSHVLGTGIVAQMYTSQLVSFANKASLSCTWTQKINSNNQLYRIIIEIKSKTRRYILSVAKLGFPNGAPDESITTNGSSGAACAGYGMAAKENISQSVTPKAQTSDFSEKIRSSSNASGGIHFHGISSSCGNN